MPAGDPWPQIRTFLDIESAIRTTGKLERAKDEALSAYWRDLARMLQIFRLKQDGGLEEIQRIRNDFSCELYRPFVDRVIRKLAAIRSHGNLGNGKC